MGSPAPTSLETARPSFERTLALAGYAALFASGFADNARGPVLPFLVDTFRCGDTQASVLLGLASLAGLPGGLAGGALVARFGPRATLRLMGALTALGLALVGAAGALAGGSGVVGANAFALVPIAALILGFGLAGLGVVSNFYVALSATPEQRGRALARLHVLYALASVSVPFLITEASARAPWTLVIALGALVPGSLVPISWLLPFVPPIREGGAASETPLGETSLDGRQGIAHDQGAVALYALAISLFVVGEVSVSGWMTIFVKRTTELSPGWRAALLSGFFVGMFVSRSVSSVLLREDRIFRAIVGCALATAALVLAGLHVSPVFLMLAGAPVGVLFPAAMASLTLSLPAASHGKAIGIVTAAYSTALALSHTAIGRASDAWTIGPALHLSPLCLVLGAVVMLWNGPARESASEAPAGVAGS